MTVSTSTSFVSYAGNGSLTTFAYTFKIFQDSDLLVTLVNDASGVETTQVLTTNYTVTGAGTASGGNVTFTTAPASGVTIKIRRVLPVTQETDYVANDPFPAEAHEDALDKLTMLVQQEAANSDLAISFPEGDVGSGLNNILPSAIDRAGSFLRFDSNGNVETSSTSEFTPTAIFATRGEGDGSTTAFSLPVTLSANPSSVQVYIDGVHQNQNSYSTSGNVLTFTEAPPNKSSIEFTIFSVGSLSSISATQVSIVDANAYYTSNAVEAALQEVGDTGILNSTGSTGTGSVVLGTSPTIATPTITGQFAGFSGNALSAGAGFTSGTGTLHKSSVSKDGTIFVTRIFVDLTGANCGGTAGDIIGDDGTSDPCHIGQITSSLNGSIFFGQMRCIETPAGGDTDIDLYVADEGTGVEDGAISSLTETQIINGGTQSAGDVDLFSANPSANQYLYLVGQGGGDATYTAGQFLIELYGYA